MRHNPNNAHCDKVVYAGAENIQCTCDIDDADEVPAPSVVMPAGFAHAISVPAGIPPREATAYAELKAAARELDAAKQMLKPAEERWRRALDSLHEAMLRS